LIIVSLKLKKANSGQPGDAKLPIPLNAGTAGPPEKVKESLSACSLVLRSGLFFVIGEWLSCCSRRYRKRLHGIDELIMKKENEELYDFLYAHGKIGRLRKRLVSLLICIEDIHDELKSNGEEDEEIAGLVKKIELLLSEFAVSQQMADRIIISLTPMERKAFIEEVPGILDVFGWHSKFDEDGNVRDET